jgi:ribosomal protein S18 acetylase RimI-like enzyme
VTASKGIDISMYRPHLRDVPNARLLPDGCRLRQLGRDDEPQLAALLRSAFAEPWDGGRVASTLTRAQDVKAVYGVFCQNELVATASSQFLPGRDPHAGFVHWVATDPSQRGKGLAAVLLGRLLKDFEARGYRSARLFTQRERLPAIWTYLKFGFVPEYEVDGRDDRSIWSGIFQAVATPKR